VSWQPPPPEQSPEQATQQATQQVPQQPTEQAPQQAEHYPAQPQFPPPGQPAAGPAWTPTTPAVLRWAGAAVVVCLLLTGAVVLHRTVLSRIFGGASSPAEAVTRAIDAIEHGDIKQLGLLLVPPDEVAGFSDIAKQAQRISSALGESNGDATANPSDVTNGVHVSVQNLQLKTRTEQAGLAKVSIEYADITASFDPAKFTGPLKKYFDKNGATAKDATVTVRGPDVKVNGRTDTLRLGGHDQSPFLMTVQRDGSWYISPMFTYFQYLTESEGQSTSPAVSSPGYGSPVEAAQAYVAALAKTINTHDITPFARATGGVEGRILQTYRNLVNSQLGKGSGGLSVDVTGSRFSVLSADANTARVRPESLHVSATSDSETHTVDWDGHCLAVGSEGRGNRRFCLGDKAALGPFSPLIERLDYVVAVRTDGGWKVSATRTVFRWVADVLSWVGDAEMPVIRALIHRDPVELTKTAKVAATVNIGSSGTAHIDAIGPYLDGGYAVVTVPNPNGKRFSVYCHAKSGSCKVGDVITPSGKTDSHYYAGQSGETGDYKAFVMAQTGDVQIRVQSSSSY
jgi:hypothetical protein